MNCACPVPDEKVLVELVPIPAADVEASWHLVEPWVARAVREGARIETVESYKARCLDRSAQLWLLREKGEVAGAGITEIYDCPQGPTCAVPVLAAVSFETLEVLFETVEQWARAEGCVSLEGYGRFGWVRSLKPYGWRPVAAVIEKDL